jgi:hypothetical protein
VARTAATVLLGAALAAGSSGCAALTNPVADGVPARLVPPEFLAPPKSGECPVPLNLLRQSPPAEYRLSPGDVLGVYIEGYIGGALPPPGHVGPRVQPRDCHRQPASTGYPVPVQDDGSIDLPAAGPVPVQGLTVAQARDAIRDLFLRKVVKPDVPLRIIVTLIEPRRYTVLVFRQEAVAFAGTPDTVIPTSKRGAGYEVQLPAYQNDVLHALARTGGLPGLDVYNEVLVYRDCFRDEAGRAAVADRLAVAPPGGSPVPGVGMAVTRIPLHHAPSGSPCVRPEDVVLGEGDVVYLAARDQEVFFTAGLLPPGVHVIPRDRDLDVVEAVSLVRGPLVNGAFAVSNLSGTLIQPGIGNPSPGLLTVVRRTPGGGLLPIVVDLNLALREPTERIRLAAGDTLILQEKPQQALARYFSQSFLNFELYWQAIRGRSVVGIVDAAGPDRLPNRPAVVNFNRQ